jgi:hypothetical protein
MISLNLRKSAHADLKAALIFVSSLNTDDWLMLIWLIIFCSKSFVIDRRFAFDEWNSRFFSFINQLSLEFSKIWMNIFIFMWCDLISTKYAVIMSSLTRFCFERVDLNILFVVHSSSDSVETDHAFNSNSKQNVWYKSIATT